VATILPTGKSTDGVKKGSDLPLIRELKAVTDAVIVASGGEWRWRKTPAARATLAPRGSSFEPRGISWGG